jgi:hypothetical protein
VVVTVRTLNESKVVMDATGEAFHAAIGYFEGHEIIARHSVGGDPDILETLAEIIADRLAG